MIQLEVCCADLESVKAAKEGGAQRVELCADLENDGVTPSETLIRDALAIGIRVHVLIRCRSGNFVYTEEEVERMVTEVTMAKRLGAHGVVIGALTNDGGIDVAACQRMIQAAEGMSVTYHRAFDVCRSPLEAYHQIEALGCHRLLTSGQQPTAFEGKELIRELVALNGKVSVMPGSGVTPQNAAYILQYTGAHEIHGTLRSVVNGSKVTTFDNVRSTVRAISEVG